MADEEVVVETNGDGKKIREDRKRDETPIEELYDLSQPIPKVDRPNKDEHEKALQALTDEIEKMKAERAKIQEKIDSSMADPNAKGGLQEQRNKLAELKKKKGVLIAEKQAMRNEMEQARTQTDKLIKDKKDVKSNIKFNNLEDIEKEIAKLQKTQETTSMSLQDEKKLIKEMDALKASKKYIADLKAKDTGLDDVKEQKKNIKDRITAKDKDIDAVSKEVDEIMAMLKEQNEQDSRKRDAIQGLFTEREDFKKQMAAKIKEKDVLRSEFREKNNAWYNYQRAVRAQKKIQYEEEKKKRDDEKAAYLAKLEAEEAKKIPYEEEQALCDYLADYLERTYLSAGKETDAKNAKKDDVVAVSQDPFAGLTPAGKKGDEDEYFGKGKGKKKRNRQNKKDAVAGPFTLSVDSFEQFGLVQLSPPTSIDQVQQSVKELREKKEWYKQQPRGSVPTAAEIRKAGEKEVAKYKQSEANQPKKGGPKTAAGGSFSLSSHEFVPLGEGGSSQVNSSWGVAKPAAASEED